MVDQSLRYLVLGAGVTGRSVLRYLLARGCDCSVADQLPQLPAAALSAEPLLGATRYYGGEFSPALLKQFDCLVVSPGIPVRAPAIQAARAAGVAIVGDVELFARENTAPVLAVTGSNGKSTVVSLMASILRGAGQSVSLVGNLGQPCLDALDQSPDVVVIELSSFQLETTTSLAPAMATVLNISADHLDRYHDLSDYAATKRRIYQRARQCLYNADDALSWSAPDAVDSAAAISFSMLDQRADWFVDRPDSPQYLLSATGNKVAVSAMQIAGRHNISNALAASAMCAGFVSDNALLESGLGGFSGLPHRMQLVRSASGVRWYNDSKGTNAGAAISALQGMDGPVILIAGGRGKNADYQDFVSTVAETCRAVILIGEEAERMATEINQRVPVYRENSMAQAVACAANIAQHGDRVLLSPACASFDMFQNFEARGEAFETEVHKLCA